MLDGGAGNDFLQGSGGNDTYVFGRGYGQDTIQNVHAGSGVSVLKFNADTASSDVRLSRSGDDLVLSIVGTTDTVTVRGCFASDTFQISSIQFSDGVAWAYADVVGLLTAGTSGDDTLVGDGNANILDGGVGNDYLKGWGGNDTYIFGRGYGQDTINAMHGLDRDVPILLFNADTASSDVTLKRSGNNLILSIAGTTDTMTITGYFESWVYRVHAIQFSDGTSWDYLAVMAAVTTGTSGNDTIVGSASLSEVLDGGAGCDTLKGWGGNDVYVFGRGYGQDTINAIHTSSDDFSVLSFNADTLPSDVVVSRSGTNLIFSISGTTDKVTLQDYFRAWQYQPVAIQFSVDGTSWDYAAIIDILTTGGSGNDVLTGDGAANTLDGKAGNDSLTGNGGCDTYVFGRGYGQDTINNAHNFDTELSVLQFKDDIAPSDVTIKRSGGDLVFSISGTTDSVTVAYYFSSSSYRIATVQFADGTSWDKAAILSILTTGTSGDDVLLGDASDNVFDGKAGNDTLTGNGGNDTYLFGRGYGQDVIYNAHSDNGVSVLSFLEGTAPSDIVISRSGNSLVLSIAGTTDKVTVNNYFAGTSYRLASLRFADGTSWSYQDMVAKITKGTSGADTLLGTYEGEVLDGGTGNDTLTGNGGSDTYMFGRGYGQDVIYNEHYDSGASILIFNADTAPSDVMISRSGNSLVLKISGTTDQVTINKFFSSTYYRLASIQFSDGTSWSYQDMISSVTTGTAGNDALLGDSGNNTIDGKAGNDTLTGNAGSDTYVFGRGYGQDTIYNEHYDSASSILRFNADVDPSDIVISKSGNSLVLKISGTTDQVTVNKYFSGTYYQLSSIQFADGTAWSYQTVSALSLGTSASETLTGTSANNTFYGSSGSDVLNGGGGYDTYVIGSDVGQTVINNLASDGVSTPLGEVDFASGLSSSNLWFTQSGADLQISVLGTSSAIKISGWFGAEARAQVESFSTADGAKLDSQVSQLVSAMASYAANNSGFNPVTATAMPADTFLQTALTSAWH